MNKTKVVKNKKAQEGFSLTFFLALAIGIIALVLIALWLMGFFDFISPEQLPKDMEIVAQSCIIALRGNLQITYCTDFKEITYLRKKQYINCEYEKIKPVIDEAIKNEALTRIICQGNPAVNFCKDLKDSLGEAYKEDTLVNGKPCKELLGT